MILKAIILVALARLLTVTDRPFITAGIYTGIMAFFAIISGFPFLTILLYAGISMALASIYFWLLDYTEETIFYWPILIIGAFLVI